MRPLLAVGRLFVAAIQAVETAVPSVCIKNCNLLYDFLRISDIT